MLIRTNDRTVATSAEYKGLTDLGRLFQAIWAFGSLSRVHHVVSVFRSQERLAVVITLEKSELLVLQMAGDFWVFYDVVDTP